MDLEQSALRSAARVNLAPSAARPATPLRFLVCGSVDDGKSTLIGRLLYDTSKIPDDQLAALRRDSARYGTTAGDIDFALLVDGLEAEREQGITIDVAYRYFASAGRRFVVIDVPGHEQYTRNMATGASDADLALVLVDARHGVLAQTRRHSCVASLLGIRRVVLLVNKMDLVGFDQATFERIRDAYREVVRDLFDDVLAIPVAARTGDNVASPSRRMPWYDGPILLDYLQTVELSAGSARPFCMPVQWVNRRSAAFRGYAGTIAVGSIRPGDAVAVSGSDRAGTVRRIVTMDGDCEVAHAGDAVTLVLAEQIDISRGDVLTAPEARLAPVNGCEADLVWLNGAPLLPGRSYLVKTGARVVSGMVTRVLHKIDIGTFATGPASTLGLNDVGRVALSFAAPVAVAPYRENRALGGFIVIDRQSNMTVGVGMVTQAASAGRPVRQAEAVGKAVRAGLKEQRPVAVWLTGLSGAGKSTIAGALERRLVALGRHAYLLDGDNLRSGLNCDLGFDEADRVENVRRAAEVARLMVDAGLIVIVALISPYRSDRDAARERFEPAEFLEVFVDTPIEECRRRDPKGLYRKADSGLIPEFTGISSPYEPPVAPEMHLRTLQASADTLADSIIGELRQREIIP